MPSYMQSLVEEKQEHLAGPGNCLNEQKSVAKHDERDNHNQQNEVPDSLVRIQLRILQSCGSAMYITGGNSRGLVDSM